MRFIYSKLNEWRARPVKEWMLLNVEYKIQKQEGSEKIITSAMFISNDSVW